MNGSLGNDETKAVEGWIMGWVRGGRSLVLEVLFGEVLELLAGVAAEHCEGFRGHFGWLVVGWMFVSGEVNLSRRLVWIYGKCLCESMLS